MAGGDATTPGGTGRFADNIARRSEGLGLAHSLYPHNEHRGNIFAATTLSVNGP